MTSERRYCLEVDDALAIAEQVDVSTRHALLTALRQICAIFRHPVARESRVRPFARPKPSRLPGAPRYLAYDRSFSAARHRGKINIKVTPRAAGPMGMVAAGDADIAVMPVSEILRAPGVD